MIWASFFTAVFLYSLVDGFLGLMFPFAFVLLSRDILIVFTYLLFFTTYPIHGPHP